MRRKGNQAVSLVTTLLVIVVLSTVVVAFLQSTSLDRMTAKSTKNALQAELSARAGLQSAINQLLTAAGTNNGFVKRFAGICVVLRGLEWCNEYHGLY